MSVGIARAAEPPSPLPSISLPDRLRAETRCLHDAVERELDWERRVATLAGYRILLSRWWGFHAGWEREAAHLVEAALFEPRRKLALLERDLRGLGMKADEIAALPTCALRIAGRAEALGAMYVLEGSTLGGQVIARAVAASLGVGPEVCAYYRAYGPRTGLMWREFRSHLLIVPKSEHEAVLAGATATFSYLRGWLPGAG